MCTAVDSTDPIALNRGLVYYLPKTLLKISVNYIVSVKGNGSQMEYLTRIGNEQDTANKLVPAINIEAVAVADHSLGFCIDTTRLTSPGVATGGVTSGWTDTHQKAEVANQVSAVPDDKVFMPTTPLSISISGDHRLAGIQACFDDRSARTLDLLAKGALDVAKATMTFAAYGSTEPNTKLISKIGNVRFTTVIDPKDAGPYNLTCDSVKDQIKTLVLAHACEKKNFADLARLNSKKLFPDIYVHLEEHQEIQSIPNSGKVMLGKKSVEGAVVRMPARGTITTSADYGAGSEQLARETVPIAQLGNIVAIPISSTLFSKRTHELKLSTDGTVETYAFAATSSLKTLSGELKNISEMVFTAFRDVFPTLGVDVRNDIVSSEAGAIQAENDLLDAQNTLKAAQDALNEKRFGAFRAHADGGGTTPNVALCPAENQGASSKDPMKPKEDENSSKSGNITWSTTTTVTTSTPACQKAKPCKRATSTAPTKATKTVKESESIQSSKCATTMTVTTTTTGTSTASSQEKGKYDAGSAPPDEVKSK